MSILSHDELTRAVAQRRWTYTLTLLLAVAGLSETWSRAAALSLPIIGATVAVHFFTPMELRRWLDRGYLLTTDLLLATLALVGTMSPRPIAFVGLYGMLLIAAMAADRMKTLLAGCAVAGMFGALAAGGAVSGLPLNAQDAWYLPLLVAASLYFGLLAEFLPRREDAQAETATTVNKANNELWALLDITDTITSTLDMSQVMHSIVARVGELARTPDCSILLTDNCSPGACVMASKGHPEATMMELDLAKYPEVRQALQTRQPVVIDDVESDPRVDPVRDVLLAKGYRTILVLPLLFGKEVLGVLFLKSREPSAISEDVVRFCRVAACVSANALKNATLYGDMKREAARHQETGEKLRRIVDGTPDMIVATDTGGLVTEFNRGAAEMTDWSPERAMNTPLSTILGQSLEGSDNGDDGPVDVTVRRHDGSGVEVSLVSAPLCGPDRTEAGRVWIGRDVTQLRRVERSLAQAERLSSLGEVVAGVAHELNNPLSGVVGYAELLRSGACDPAQIRDLERIVESAMRCQKIVFKLLSFARKHPPEKRYQSLNDCVKKVLDLKAYHLSSSQIQAVLELDPELPDTCFDFHQIDQVVLNLLNNAEQAISSVKRSGRIVLRTGQAEGFVYVEVEDDGPGVSAAVQERVFDPFFTTKELGKGTGLGLSVSYGIVQEHGGRIELTGAKTGEGGATFRITLPIVQGERPVAQPAVDSAGERDRLTDRKILIADDEPTVLELLGRLLTQEGARVTLAQDGEEAWNRLLNDDFDLIIADLRMPNLSGQELYERVAENRPELLRRFVFATGDLVRHETMAFLEGLPNRILTKPLEQETVRRVLTQAIQAA